MVAALAGIFPQERPDPADLANLDAVQERWAQIEQDTQDFVENLDEAGLKQIISYTNTKGQPNVFPLWQIMLHQVNHAAQHRSKVAAMLTQLGHSPGWLDLILYLAQQKTTAEEN